MQLATKHRGTKPLNLSDFSGGLRLDIAASSDKFLPNMLQKAVNVELDYVTGKLKVVDGLVPVVKLPAAADTLFYNYKDNYFLSNCGRNLYRLNGNLSPRTEPVLVGQLNSIKRPSYAVYGAYTAVVSGSKVQYLTYKNEFKEATASPVADMCYVRSGRLGICITGSDTINWCGTGDIENWNFKTDNPQDAWYAEIGYQEGGGIVAVKELFGNVVIIKRSGKSFRLTGDYYWQNYDGPQGVFAVGQNGVIFAGNGLYYIGKDGFSAIAFNSGEFGTLRTSEVGAAVNQLLIKGVSQNAKLWDVQPKKQVWIRADEMGTTYLFHYFSGAFTVRKFSQPIADVCLVGNTVYVLAGDTIYRLDENADTEIGGNPIQIELEGKLYTTLNEFLIKRLAASIDARGDVDATVQIGKLVLPIQYAAHSPYLADCTDYLADADYPLWTLEQLTRETKRQTYRVKKFAIRITSTKGAFSINNINLEVVEV